MLPRCVRREHVPPANLVPRLCASAFLYGSSPAFTGGVSRNGPGKADVDEARRAASHPRVLKCRAAWPPDQALGGLYPTLVSCARFIAASASLAVISVVVSKRVKPPVAAAAIEHAAAAVLSGNSQIATPSYSPNEI